MSAIKKSRVARLASVLTVASAAVLVFGQLSRSRADFKPAQDFPRAALIYVQIEDLPAAIRLWNESELKRRYLESENFRAFSRSHLALKIAERWNELSASAGFALDSEVLSSIADKRAALAVYDIGKLELVLIAPAGEERILASNFFQFAGSYERIELDDGTAVYSIEAEIDRGRGRQKILFADFEGRFVLATSEKYFLQTLDNIRGKTPRNRLAAAPEFRQLAEQSGGGLATVWLDQQSLSEEWYFKRYWLMSDAAALKALRAGLFTFDLNDDAAVEKRIFLLAAKRAAPRLKPDTARRLRATIPAEAPFFQIEGAERSGAGTAVADVLFDRADGPAKSRPSPRNYHFYDRGKSDGYTYLDSDYEESIDGRQETETKGDETGRRRARLHEELSRVIGAGGAVGTARIFSPLSFAGPLFFENRKALVLSLAKAGAVSRQRLETALIDTARENLTAADSGGIFEWEDLALAAGKARRLKMPVLGWSVFYAVKNEFLVFANSEELLAQIMAAETTPPPPGQEMESLTVIRLAAREAAFGSVMKQIRRAESSSEIAGAPDFFVDDVGGLLDVVSNVERIEISRRSNDKYLYEEIEFFLDAEDKRDE